MHDVAKVHDPIKAKLAECGAETAFMDVTLELPQVLIDRLDWVARDRGTDRSEAARVALGAYFQVFWRMAGFFEHPQIKNKNVVHLSDENYVLLNEFARRHGLRRMEAGDHILSVYFNATAENLADGNLPLPNVVVDVEAL